MTSVCIRGKLKIFKMSDEIGRQIHSMEEGSQGRFLFPSVLATESFTGPEKPSSGAINVYFAPFILWFFLLNFLKIEIFQEEACARLESLTCAGY